MQYHLRQVMIYLDALVFNRPEVFIGAASTKFDAELKLSDPATRDIVQKQLAGFEIFVRRIVKAALHEVPFDLLVPVPGEDLLLVLVDVERHLDAEMRGIAGHASDAVMRDARIRPLQSHAIVCLDGGRERIAFDDGVATVRLRDEGAVDIR